MSQTMVLNLNLDPKSLRDAARILENAADAIDPMVHDSYARSDALESEQFARMVAKMTTEQMMEALAVSGQGLPGIVARASDDDSPTLEERDDAPDMPEEPPVWSSAATPPAPIEPIVPVEPPLTMVPDVDSAGLPWDERIHASTRALLADGTWRKKRGVNEIKVREVEAELRAKIPAPIIDAPAPIDEPIAPPPPPPPAPIDEPIAPPPPPPAGELISLPVADPEIRTFKQLLPFIGKHKFTQGQITLACQNAGVPSVPVLAQRQDLIPQVVKYLKEISGVA